MKARRRRHEAGLSTVFAGLSPRAFLNRYRSGEPVWRHGSPKRFDALAGLASIGAVMTLAGRSRIEVKAMFHGVQHEANEFQVDVKHVFSLYDAGATVSFMDLHRWHAEAGEWTQRLADELHVPFHTAGCNLYMSPAGKGLPMHFDHHEVIVIQLAGQKRWRIAKNDTVVNPLENSGAELTESVQSYATGPAPTRMPRGHSITLAPGSAIFLPRGYWHSTDARLGSISITFGFRQPTWIDVVREHLTQQLKVDADWREPVWNAWDPEPPIVAVSQRWAVLRDRLTRVLADTDAAQLFPSWSTPAPARRSPRPRSKRLGTHAQR